MRLSLVYKLVLPGLLVLYTGVMLGLHLGLLQRAVVVANDNQQFLQQLLPENSKEMEPVYRHESHFGVYNQKDRRPLNDLQSYRKVEQERQTLKLMESSDGGGTLQTKSSTSVGNISVFSVYYDNRPTLKNGQPCMRIIALKRFNSVESLICHFNYGHNTWLKVHAHSYEMCENHGRYYGGWIFSCEIPEEILNNTVLEKLTVLSISSTFHPEKQVKLKITAITFKESFEKSSSSVTIPSSIHSHLKFENSQKQKFGLCLPPIFGDISLSLLIQFIELSKILGSSHLTFYIYDISDAVEKLLTFYEEEGEVTLVNWKLSPQINEREIWYHGQLLAIQDCLYRHMADFEYLLFVDLDEFLLPVYNYTWSDMVHFLRNFESESNNVAGFSFKSAFFDPKQVPDPSQQLTFLQLLLRNKVLSSVRTKLMVAPQKIFELGIHHVSKTIHKDMRILEVDPGIAKIHHYRPCIINYEPDMKCYSEERDETILKYATNLVENYQTIIRETLDLFVPDR
ncbi:beta-1,4-galactosyltransferase galt-1-like [Mizuhopecten yessoensis]|uniref:beta-1,4-galactosyltransferase galt-1-like n=1 Tax=Mizuhopecten yessoensis TaxID=6573 RepID=UPI000B45D5B0|nr:beta-1,4-galactosyltransferase galt-1-like [Mizuhopecten yessoensis]